MTALVTGGAGAIGRAIVEALVVAGASVISVDLAAAHPPVRCVEQLTADIASAVGRAELAAAARSRRGLDHLVIAHGIVEPADPALLEAESWARVERVNSQSAFFLCRDLAPLLRDGGAIVTVGSLAGKAATTIQNAAYSASKAALIATTQMLATWLAPRIRANCVCPGVIDSPMMQDVFAGIAGHLDVSVETVLEARRASIPLRRLGTPADVAGLVLYLLSDGASYLTGQAIDVAGGLLMPPPSVDAASLASIRVEAGG